MRNITQQKIEKIVELSDKIDAHLHQFGRGEYAEALANRALRSANKHLNGPFKPSGLGHAIPKKGIDASEIARKVVHHRKIKRGIISNPEPGSDTAADIKWAMRKWTGYP